jgi:hypothetical protein
MRRFKHGRLVTGSHTSNLIAESGVGDAVAAARQNAGRVV